MAWWAVAAAALGAGANYLSTDAATGAAKDTSKQNIELARENRNLGLQLYEPQRAFGYGAMSDLASLYGYAIPAYTPLNQLVSSGGAPVALNRNATMTPGGTNAGPMGAGFYGPITVNGRRATGTTAGISTNPFSKHNRAYAGVIDPVAGTVDLKNMGKKKKEARIEARATAYLRGEKKHLRGSGVRRIRSTIDDMREAGYAYDPNASQPGTTPGAPGSTPGTPAPPAAGPTGQPGNFSRFFTSPDYQWRLDQQNKAIERSAAARGGLYTGATGVALARESGNMASQEYGNYFERLMRMMGYGGAGTNAAVSANDNATGQIIQANNMYGNARASSYMANADNFNNLLGNLYYTYRRGA